MAKYSAIFADDLDDKTKEQFESCVNLDYVVAGALMPDAHSGYVAPIGSVLITKGKVVPSWVGYDIGCGVIAVNLKSPDLQKRIKENDRAIYNEVRKNVPMGLGKMNHPSNVHRESVETFHNLLKRLSKYSHDPEIFKWIKNKGISSLGTLGHGNHFIELSYSEDDPEDEAWLVIHSGSRNVGHKVAEKYMKKSAKKDKDFEETYPLDVNSQMGAEYLSI